MDVVILCCNVELLASKEVAMLRRNLTKAGLRNVFVERQVPAYSQAQAGAKGLTCASTGPFPERF